MVNKLAIILFLLIMATVLPVAAEVQSYGTVEFIIRAGGSAQDTTIYLKPAGDSIPFDSRFMYTDEIPGQNEGWSPVEIQPDGISLPQYLNAGTITACIRNSQGNQKECINFTLNPGEHKRVVMLGSPVASSGHPEEEQPGKICTTKQVWRNGYWYDVIRWVCDGDAQISCTPQPHCGWKKVWVWHPGFWKSVTVCEE